MAVRGVFAVGVTAVAAACGGGDSSDEPADARIVPAGATTKHEIAFIRHGARGRGDVFTMNADGSEKTNLTETRGVHEQDPAWSPDGKLIAFSRQSKRGFYDIWVMSADGDDRARLTDEHGTPRRTGIDGAMDPAWSPDGDLIAFTRWTGQVSDIWVMTSHGRERRNLTRSPSASEYGPDWSPSGRRIVFIEGEEITVMKRDGSRRRSLTRAPIFERLYEHSPTYAPNGRKIAFLASPNSPVGAVWMMNADGSHPVRVRERPRGSFGPTFSPNGNRIVIGDGLGFFVFRADGKGRATRLPGRQVNDQDPAWSPASSSGGN